jgi:hypothetical protein
MNNFDTNRLALRVAREVSKRLGNPKISGSRKYWRNLAVADMSDVELKHWLDVRAQVRAEMGGAS